MREYYVYILASASRRLYIGVTNDLERRLREHRNQTNPGFTKKYNVTMLVWYDVFADAEQAIACEKRLKGWRRSKKLELIEQLNPMWLDMSADGALG